MAKRANVGTATARQWSLGRGTSIAGVDPEELRPRMFSHILLVSVAVFFVVFLSWASWAALEEVTRGDGTVIPSRQVQVVQNLEGGIVAELMVREGEIVEQGQVLMRIDNVRAASDYREQRARYLALLAGIARLEAEVGETAIEFPDEVLTEAPSRARSETALFNSRQEELEAELEILRSQAEQRQQELEELKKRLSQFQTSFELASEELAITEPLARQQLISRAQLLRLRREVNDLEGQLEQTRLAVPRVEAAHREANQRIASAYSTFRSEALRELNLQRTELAGITETIVAGEDRVRRTEVRSPVRGTVKLINFNTIGGVIQPGEDLMEITPLEDTLLIEANIRPADIAFLHPGHKASVKITAYDYAIYGGLAGEVEHISAGTITNDKGESFYKVRVRTERNYLGTEQAPLEIIPGMTAQVDVITGDKTVLDYLLKPILKAQQNALRER